MTKKIRLRPFAPVWLAILAWIPGTARQGAPLSTPEAAIVRGITAAALRQDVEFLASDALEGRDTPSPGLDRAADYIAAQMRAAGLEKAGDQGYFQTAAFETITQTEAQVVMSLTTQEDVVRIPLERLSWFAPASLDLAHADLYLLDPDHLPSPAETRGKALLLDLASLSSWTPEQRAARAAVLADPRDPQGALAKLEAAALIYNRAKSDRFGATQIRERPASLERNPATLVCINDEGFRRLVAGWKPGPVPAAIDLALPAAVVRPAALKNVLGLLRGSDASLRETCVVVSAHYDHLGVLPGGEGDRIANGANDNASGVAALLDIARAITAAGLKPRRSILFAAYFGEEKGLLGSEWYVRHPVFPLARTVANLNLEQLGRIDDQDGPQPARAFVTGFDYSEVGDIVARSGSSVGVTFLNHPKNNEQAFPRSDNGPLARAGVPAHTVGVTVAFPGRHTAGDEADAIDYANMEAVTRGLGLATWSLAMSDQAPGWKDTNPGAAPYAKARSASR